MLELLDRLGLGPDTDTDVVATALDDVAVSCSPHRDLAVNPAKLLASGIAETSPLLWGGTVLAARAARRIAESLRRASGRAALAADAEHLLPVLAAARPADVFADPFADPEPDLRPSLVVLDDGSADPVVARDPGAAGGGGRTRTASASRWSPPRRPGTSPGTPRCSRRACTPRATCRWGWASRAEQRRCG